MKPEPLKDKYEKYGTSKLFNLDIWLDKQRDNIRLSSDASGIFNNIKSAVEWSNIEIDKRIDVWKEVCEKADTKEREEGCIAIVNVLFDAKKVINKAFEDVTKTGWMCVDCGKGTANPEGSMKHPYCKECFKKVWNDNYDDYNKFLETH